MESRETPAARGESAEPLLSDIRFRHSNSAVRPSSSYRFANSSKSNQAALQSGAHRLGGALVLKLLEQCVDVQFHSTLRDVKLRADLLVSHSFSNELKYFQLACGQLQAGDATGEFRGDSRRESRLTGMNVPDALKQISWLNIFQQISFRSRPDSPLDVLVGVVG